MLMLSAISPAARSSASPHWPMPPPRCHVEMGGLLESVLQCACSLLQYACSLLALRVLLRAGSWLAIGGRADMALQTCFGQGEDAHSAGPSLQFRVHLVRSFTALRAETRLSRSEPPRCQSSIVLPFNITAFLTQVFVNR